MARIECFRLRCQILADSKILIACHSAGCPVGVGQIGRIEHQDSLRVRTLKLLDQLSFP